MTSEDAASFASVARGFLFSDLRGYTRFVEMHRAAAAVELLTTYRELVRAEVGRFDGAEIRTEGDSFYVVFDSVAAAVRRGLGKRQPLRQRPQSDESTSASAFMPARRSRRPRVTSARP